MALRRAVYNSEPAAERDQFPIIQHLAANHDRLMPEECAHESGKLPIVERSEIDIRDRSAKHFTRWDHLDQAAVSLARDVVLENHDRSLPSFNDRGNQALEFVGVVSARRQFRGSMMARLVNCWRSRTL